jgi:RHS repeat-associated protein
VTRFTYDATGNLTAITDPLGATTQIAYNQFGQSISSTDPLGNTTTISYNTLGDGVRTTDPLGNSWNRVYGPVSLVIARIDPKGRQWAFTYDPLNRPLTIVDPLGGTTAFTYDPNGNLLTVTDARGNMITYEYYPMDRRSRRTDPLGAVETYRYDLVGNLIEAVDRKGQRKVYTYDPLNRRVQMLFADGAISTFTYDAAGRLVLADDTADPHRPITLTYDGLDRLVAETTGLGTLAYEYDVLGRRTQMRVNDLSPVTYTYNANSRLHTITQTPLNTVTIDYDALGRRTRLTLPNAVSTEYQYDAVSRLTGLIYRNALGLLGDLTYTYDPAGNRTGVGGSFARTLLPDPVVAATYDAANRLLTFGDKSMTYDANGNLTSIIDPSGVTTFAWDARNHLTATNEPGLSATFSYDGLGRRAQRTVNALRSEFQYDIANIIAEARAGSGVTYLRGLSVDELLSTTDGSGTRHHTTDPLGSILHLTDAQGTIQADYRYGPFGQTQRSGPEGGNPFQFTGRENDGTGLHHYRFRYYHPTLGRFISEDPVRPLSGSDHNLYTYVSSSPLSAVDPFGLYNDDVHLNLTYCLARHAGFSVVQAGRVAARNLLIDYDPETAPVTPRNVQARRDWHFTTPERRVELWSIAIEGTLEDLGNYMHALQDSYSHAGFEPPLGHVHTPLPDITAADPQRANRMARDTYNHLRIWLETQTGQQSPDRFDQIRDQVDRFNRAWTAGAKARYVTSWCGL